MTWDWLVSTCRHNSWPMLPPAPVISTRLRSSRRDMLASSSLMTPRLSRSAGLTVQVPSTGVSPGDHCRRSSTASGFIT